MKSSAELLIILKVISQIIIIYLGEIPNIAGAKAYVTIVRRHNRGIENSHLTPDRYILHKSNCTQPLPNHCTEETKRGLVTFATQCECVCDKQQPTIGYVNHKWSCAKDDVTRNLTAQSCKLRFSGEGANQMFLMKTHFWKYILLWTYIHGTKCNIDWSTSGVSQCNNTITPITENPPDIQIKKHNGRYWLHFLTLTKEVEGRIVKIGIRCDEDPSYSYQASTHCLMLKVEGKINCPIKPLPVPTTPIPTTTLPPPTDNDNPETEVSTTVTTSTRGSGETEKRREGGGSVPVLPIAGGVTAVLTFAIILVVFLFWRKKHQRKMGRSSMQGAQQQQAEQRLSEDVYYSNIKSRSPALEGVNGLPVYESVTDRDNSLDTANVKGVEVVTANTNQEYDCVWNGVETNPLIQNSTEQFGSENYDYARPEGPTDNNDFQDAMYDVPECEVGTLRPLPGQNYYEEAGSVIPGEEASEASDQEPQDATDDVTANPLYSFSFAGHSADTPN